jgi:hypothetical protein
MQVISRDEIRLDDLRVKVVWVFVDEWGRKITNSTIITKPLRRA